jgi:glycosyltransferase involved in cell wall biosynthesis/predicted glycoside hydrolase/deacetylase ChbG (UPF0249 family)
VTERRLIVNADELGLTEGVNQAIAEAFEHGIVTSTSLIVNMWALDSGVRTARRLGIPVGVHLNLTDGAPVLSVDRVSSLVDEAGRFFSRRALLWRASRGLVNRHDVEAELAAQIARARDAGLEPTHLDSHQHVYIHPLIFEVVIELARQHRLAIRSPRERLLTDRFTLLRMDWAPLLKKVGRSWLGGLLVRMARRRGVMTTDQVFSITGNFRRFRGITQAYRQIFQALPAGTSEVMTHPGYVDSRLVAFVWHGRVEAARREAELRALCDPELREMIARGGIILTDFRVLRGPRRVLHVMSAGSIGGIENHVCTLVAGADRARFRQSAAYLFRRPDDAAGVAVRLQATRAEVHDLGFRRRLDFAGWRRLRLLLREGHADVVHVHGPLVEVLVGLVAWRMPVRIVSSVHNIYSLYARPLARLPWRLASRRFDGVIAISRAVAEHLERDLRLSRDRIRIIHYGVDPGNTRAAPGMEEAGSDRDAVIVNVARLAVQKGQRYLVEAMPKVLASEPRARLVIVGHDTDGLAESLRDLARRVGVADRVTFTGFLADVSAVLRRAQVFALSSLYEGFGLVLLEAMAAGVPVVATNVGPVPEIIAHGQSGLLVPPRDPVALADAIVTVLGRPDIRATLSAGGLARVREGFSAARMCRAVGEVWEG